MKPATTLSMILLLVIAAGHIVRLVARWPVTIDGMTVPLWISAVAGVLLVSLVAATFREQR